MARLVRSILRNVRGRALVTTVIGPCAKNLRRERILADRNAGFGNSGGGRRSGSQSFGVEGEILESLQTTTWVGDGGWCSVGS